MRISSLLISVFTPVLVCAMPMVISTVAFNAMAAQSPTLSSAVFVKKASVANMFEIESSKLALDKSSRDDVKDFAKHMIDDHTKTAEKLQQTLQASNSKLAPAETLDGKHQRLLDQLKSAGSDFDTLYITDQTEAHKEAVALFSNFASNGDDTALTDFATNTLPALKTHLNHVKQLSGAR